MRLLLALVFAVPAAGGFLLVEAGASLLIEAPELQMSIARVRIVDVRPPDEFRKGHIPGAVNRPVKMLDDLEANRGGLPMPIEQAAAMFRELGISKDSEVVAYDDHGGRFAARFFYVAEFFGHRRVRVLNGGWKAWLAAGGASETEARPVPAGNFRPKPNPKRIATAAWISERLDRKKVALLDVRTPEEFRDNGHIPGAVHLDWRETTTDFGTGRLKSPQELRTMLESRGLDIKDETVAYCSHGTRASQLYFILRMLGNKKIRNYDASWTEWGARKDLPITRPK